MDHRPGHAHVAHLYPGGPRLLSLQVVEAHFIRPIADAFRREIIRGRCRAIHAPNLPGGLSYLDLDIDLSPVCSPTMEPSIRSNALIVGHATQAHVAAFLCSGALLWTG